MDLSPVFYMHKCIAMAEYFPLCREKILQPLSKLLRQQFFGILTKSKHGALQILPILSPYKIVAVHLHCD